MRGLRTHSHNRNPDCDDDCAGDGDGDDRAGHPRSRGRALLISVILLGALTACQPLTQIVLVVYTDLPIPTGLDHIDLTITGPATESNPWDGGQNLLTANSQPLTLGLRPGTGTSAISVRALGSLGGNPVVEQRVDTNFVSGQSRLLEILLLGDCAEVPCAGGTTCVDSACTDPSVSGASLPPWNGSLPPPPPIAPGGRTLWASGNHSCAVGGTSLYCWGQNTDGELGNGNNMPERFSVQVLDITGPRAVGLGAAHSCACDETGKAFCWGQNTSGQLGIGSVGGLHARPVAVVGVTDCVQITGGGQHTCVLHGDSDSTVSCWGSNTKGQLGIGIASGAPQTTPQPVMNLQGVNEVQAGATFTCARLRDKSVWCWGENTSGQVGDGSKKDQPLPVPVSLQPDIVELAVSPQFACVRRAMGQLACWGDNSAGQLGTGDTRLAPTPIDVPGIDDAEQIAAGGLQHLCILRAGKIISCWGGNANGQLGVGTTTSSLTPVNVGSGVVDATAVVAGYNYTCARRDKDVNCWGQDNLSQLGAGYQTPNDQRTTPVTVLGLPH